MALRPTCHPDATHYARGMCHTCYNRKVRGQGPRRGAEPHSEQSALDASRKAHAATEAARQQLLSELADKNAAIEALTRLARERKVPPIVAKKAVGRGKRRQGVPVMLLSDLHIEEPVRPAQVNGLNEYTLDIADTCLRATTEAYEWFTRDPRWDMRHGVIWWGGDFYSGYIHDELVESNQLSPVESVVWLQSRLEKQIRTILAQCNFESLIVACNDGNHGRLTNKMRVSTRTANSLEWLLYKSVAARFSDEKRVTFQVADGDYNYLNVYDTKLCFFHGDSVKYQGGVGGITVPLLRGLNELRKYRAVDVYNLGHFHQRYDMPGLVVNGSMIGTNAYSMRYKFAPEPRQQSFYIVDSARGKCMSAPVWLPQYKGA